MNAITVDRNEIADCISRIRDSRDHGVRWILNNISADGEPTGAGKRNGWSRVPWALAVSDESGIAARIVSWARKSQLAADGSFAPGAASGSGYFPAYSLAHFAIGCWLTENFDAAKSVMGALRRIQNPESGGFPIEKPDKNRPTRYYDLLSTAQAGQAAIVTGQQDIAIGAYDWIKTLVELQPADACSRFYTFRRNAELLTQPTKKQEWLAITDFSLPRQSYYTPGMAAVFLSAYGQRYKSGAALALASDLLEKNITGTQAQYDDLESVQLCKFGWGAAAIYSADTANRVRWLPHLIRMVDWFIARQAADGSWAPSRFLQPSPTDVDRLTKTAEHVVEVNAILGALEATDVYS